MVYHSIKSQIIWLPSQCLWVEQSAEWAPILSQKLDSSQGKGLKVTSLFPSRRTSYRQRDLWKGKLSESGWRSVSNKWNCFAKFGHLRKTVLSCVAYLSWRSRGVRRILRILSLCLGFNMFELENLRDTFSTAGTSLSNWANSVVCLYFLNIEAVLIYI